MVGGLTFYYSSLLSHHSQSLGCYDNLNCVVIEDSLSISHLAIGVLSFILALGFYLLFFNKTEEQILKRLEEEKEQKINEAKLEMLLRALDPFEQKVIKAVSEHQGVTQSTLRIRLDMSKAKLSYVLQELEKRGIVKRVEKGRTLEIYLRI